MAEKPVVSFRDLSEAAAELNKATDELKQTIDNLDVSLHRLSIGLSVWVEVSSWGEGDGPRYEVDQLGWSKVNGEWGISLRRIIGYEDSPEPEEVRDVWAFNDAPREMRLLAVGKLPQLLEELGGAAIKTAMNVKQKLAEARALTAALGVPSGGAVPKVSK